MDWNQDPDEGWHTGRTGDRIKVRMRWILTYRHWVFYVFIKYDDRWDEIYRSPLYNKTEDEAKKAIEDEIPFLIGGWASRRRRDCASLLSAVEQVEASLVK